MGLQHVLVGNILEIESSRASVLNSMEDLKKRDLNDLLNGATYCHLRVKNYKKKGSTKCCLCTYHDQFLKYECLLFSVADAKKQMNRMGRVWQQKKLMGSISDNLTEEEKQMALLQEAEALVETTDHVDLMNKAQGAISWADSETEKALKIIHTFARQNGLPSEVLDDANRHLKILEETRKEFKFLRIMWRKLFDQVSALDELSQATTRLRLALPYESTKEAGSSKSAKKALSSGVVEKIEKIQNIHVLHEFELDSKLSQTEGDLAEGRRALSIHLGQVVYLESLKKTGYGKQGTVNAEECPICQNQLGTKWSVLVCGHSFCSDCIKNMRPSQVAQNFLCPLCRVSMRYADVSFVDTSVCELEDQSVNTHVNSTDGTTSTESQKDDDEKIMNSKNADTSVGVTTKLAHDSSIEVKGSHSTKIEGIVRILLQLQRSHPGEKVLVYSSVSSTFLILCCS